MPKRSSKLPRDPNQLAARVVAMSTGEIEEKPKTFTVDGKNPAAVALGKLGGNKGGKARAEKLTAEQRKDIARKAALTRWQSK